MIAGDWLTVRDGDPRASALYERHYSCVNRAMRLRTGDKRICGPGEHMILLTQACDALFVWRKFRNPDGQQGIYCSVFRNESPLLSSDLIRQACELAWLRWPGERLYTYVDASKVRSCNPGYCFKVLGWRQCGISKRHGLLILEKFPGGESAREDPQRST